MHFYALGKSLQDYIPDYHSAIKLMTASKPGFLKQGFTRRPCLINIICYIHLNDSLNAARILALMKEKFPTGRYLALIENPPQGPEDLPVRTQATLAYEKVYEQFY